MDTSEQLSSNRKDAQKLMEIFGFKNKLEKILYKSDNFVFHRLAFNGVLFSVAYGSLITSSSNNLNAVMILVFISGSVSLISALLNFWYASRIAVRHKILKEKQEIIYKKAEDNLVKVISFFSSVAKNTLLTRVKDHLKLKKDKESLINMLESDNSLNYISEEGLFMPIMVMELALMETILNVNDSLNSPLNEKYSRIRLIVDKMSTRSKNIGLALGSFGLVSAMIIKFIL